MHQPSRADLDSGHDQPRGPLHAPRVPALKALRAPLLLALGAIVPLALTGTAFGHAAPERFDPAAGAVISAAPQRVDGWFTEDVRRQEGASFIKVFDSSGMQVDTGMVTVDDMDRRHMSVSLKDGLGEGRYLVAWQTFSDQDQEMDGGCYLFFVGQAAANQAHQEKVRVDGGGTCPVNIANASQIFSKNPSASITIDVPREVSGSEVTLYLATNGVTIRTPLGSGRNPQFGHYHIYLDMAPVLQHKHTTADSGMPGMSPSPSPAATDAGMQGMTSPTPTDAGMAGMGITPTPAATDPAMAMQAGPTSSVAASPTPAPPDWSQDVMVVSDSFTFKNLKPGVHVVTAALFYDDHTPFQPTVTQTASFRVADSGGGTSAETVGLILGVAAIGVLAGGAGGALLWRRGTRKGS